MSVSTVPSHISRTSTANGCPLSTPSGFAMKYPFHYVSISSFRTTKVHLSCSYSGIHLYQYFLSRQLSSNLVALVGRASDWSGRETEDAVLDEPYDFNDLEKEHDDFDGAEDEEYVNWEKQFRDVKQRGANESDEEEETEFPEDSDESDLKHRTSTRFSGDGERRGANESDEKEESEFREDPEEAYFKPRTSNRFHGDNELGGANESDEEDESEFPEDSEESYFKPRNSTGFLGERVREGANESDEEEVSEFPEDHEESYFTPRSSNRLDETNETGYSEEEMLDLGAREGAPWMYTGDSKEGLGGVHDDAEPSYPDGLEGSNFSEDEEEAHSKHNMNEQKNNIPDWVEGQEKMIVNDVGDERGENGYLQEPEEPYPKLLEEAKLYVGNLPYDVDSKKLAEIFNGSGIVEIAEVVYSRETDQSRGFGFVTMRTVEEAEKAIHMFNRREVDGRFLVVNKALDRGSPSQRARRSAVGYKAYCGNVPYDVVDSRLQEVFSEYGKVLAATIIYDKVTGQSRGFGFITMSTETELEDAIAALDGQILDGRRIRVARAEERISNNFRLPTERDYGAYGEYNEGQIGVAPDGVA